MQLSIDLGRNDQLVQHLLSALPAQIESNHQDGFLVVHDVLHSSEVAALQRWTAEVKAWPNKSGEHMPYEEKRSDGDYGIVQVSSL